MTRHELITQSFRPAEAVGQIACVRDGSLWPAGPGRRVGAWQVVAGPLNRILLLREASQSLGPILSGAPSLSARHIDLLREMKPFSAQDDWARIYELRIYTLYPDCAQDFERRMIEVLPIREHYSPNVGTWRAESGNIDRVFHMWAYADFDQRNALRPSIDANPHWQAYVAAITPLLAAMESMLLTPLTFERDLTRLMERKHAN